MRALAILVLLAACGGEEETTTGGGDTKTGDTKTEPAKESEARKALVEAWRKAGLKPADMKSSDLLAKDCKQGTVNGVEVVVCDVGSPDEAKKVEAKGLEWVGHTTGAAWTSGPLVIAVADRKKADANGKTINTMMKSTPK